MDNEQFQLKVLSYLAELTQNHTMLSQDVGNLRQDVTNLHRKVDKLDQDLNKLSNRVTIMENDNHAKFSALFDGLKQLNDKVDHIEEKVSFHDEFILKRIK